MKKILLTILLGFIFGNQIAQAGPGDIPTVIPVPSIKTCEVPSEDYPTIQSALDQRTCNVVNVASGTYKENLTISRSVSLKGDLVSPPILISASEDSSVVTIESVSFSRLAEQRVSISSFTISGGTSLQGGGIYNETNLILSEVTITSNWADLGGGIYSAENSSLTLNNSTVSQNISYESGGGIYIGENGVATITDSTISGNLVDATYLGMGGGIFSLSFLELENSEVTSNGVVSEGAQAYGGGIYVDMNASLNVSGSSISSNTLTSVETAAGGGIATASPSIINDSTINENIIFSSNADTYGGGLIAFEQAESLEVTSSDISQNEASAPGVGGYAYGGGVHSASPLSIFDTEIELNILSGSDNCFGGGLSITDDTLGEITEESSISFNSCEADGGGYGGGISGSTLNIEDSFILSNRIHANQRSFGGGIYSLSLSLQSSEVSQNTVSTEDEGSYGGGIHAGGTEEEEILIENSIIESNTVISANDMALGGGIHLYSSATITGSTISKNNVTSNISDAFRTDNYGSGGGIYSWGESLNIESSTISENTVSTPYTHATGGGIFSDADLTITSSFIFTNSLNGYHVSGGGIYTTNNSSIEQSEIYENSMTTTGGTGKGGGIRIALSESGSVSIENSLIYKNTISALKSFGGGIYAKDDSTIPGVLTIRNSVVYSNTLDSSGEASGGGIYNVMGELILVNTTLSGNEAVTTSSSTAGGGGIYNSGGSELALFNVTLAYNTSKVGGGIFLSSGSIYLKNSLLANNEASAGGNDCYTYRDTFLESGEYNLISDVDRCSFTESTGDQTGSSSEGTTINPLLGDLANNGGETMTHELLEDVEGEDSPAINAGNPDGCVDETGTDFLDYDQRGEGYARTVGDACDIGAYEVQ